MLKRITFVASVLLLAAGWAEASVQAKKVAGWLGAGDWQLRDEDDEAYLVKDPPEPFT
jgi:hypothetical protein